MKKLLIILICTLTAPQLILGQDKYYTKNGNINFEASVGGTFEEIKALNKTVTAILNTETGEIAVLALMKGFRFKIALMEEHFNENYVESDDYPRAKFTGSLEGFEKNELTGKIKTYDLTGDLNLHGKSKRIGAKASVKLVNGIVQFETSFKVKPEEFNVKIPSLVEEKIAKEIKIHAIFKLKKKEVTN